MIPQDFIHQLLDRVDLVEVIDRYVPLKKKGANYQACCPFHSEKTPSFTVSPTKQFYHCFGCGAHGTAISFLMEYGGMGFVEAVKELADRVGLVIPDDGHYTRPEASDLRDRLVGLMETAARFYKAELKGSAKAVAYLKGRGLEGRTAARFGLGYAPDDWQGLARAVPDYQSPDLEEAGLVIVNEGRRYDRFRDRVMFPIRGDRGRVIAFGGRIIGQGETPPAVSAISQPKYLNSPETQLFHKGRELYGLFENRRAIQQAGRAVVVEGYMDVVMLAQHGVDNALATLGTAVTPDHVAKLFKLVDDVVFAFDGDAAGRKAAWRALENSLPELQDGKRATFLFLPEGEDPDSYVRNFGAASFGLLCDQAKPLSDFLFEELAGRAEPTSQEGKVRLYKLVEPLVKRMARAPLLARALRKRLAEVTGLGGPERPARQVVGTLSDRQTAALPSSAQTILRAVLHRPDLLKEALEIPETGAAEVAFLTTIVTVMREHPELVSASRIYEHFRGRPEMALIDAVTCGASAWDEEYDPADDLRGALATLREQAAKFQSEIISGKKLSEISPEEHARYVQALREKKLDRLGGVKSGD